MLAIGGSAIVYELAGAAPAVLKRARWRGRDMQARFAMEAEVLRTVGPPTTPKLFEHGTDDGHPYIVMEQIGGDTLAAWMARVGDRGGLGEIVALLSRIAAALGALHDAGFVHRDLKPENLCITRGVRVLDFGLAKPLRGAASGLTQAAIVGTPHYMAPEQIRTSATVDHRADIYAFGVIAFELLAGRPPFVGERRAIEYQHQVVHPPSVRETRELPPQLDELVLRCLAKQPDARPASMRDVQQALTAALAAPSTIRGIGSTAQTPASGRQRELALAWIAGGDPLAVTRAVTAVNGIVARQRGDGVIAAFTATMHDTPIAVGLEVCRALVHERCRIVLHSATALLRQTPGGKATVYGRELEQLEAWTPAVPFSGLLLTQAAVRRGTGTEVPAELEGYFRERDAASVTTHVARVPRLVGRDAVVEHVLAALERGATVDLYGDPGVGKTRTLEAVAQRLRPGHDVVAIRVRRRLPGDLADDAETLAALRATAGRRAVLVVDDADQLSRACRHALLDASRTAVLASQAPLFASTEHRLAIALPELAHAEAAKLLRDQLRPARLIPDVVIERIGLRGAGNPRILLALVDDMKRRGALRRHAGSDEWYVAVDELDTLLAPPSEVWLATRILDELPREVVSVLRFASALGPTFRADELAHVLGVEDVTDRLAFLVREQLVLAERGGYELVDHALGAAIYHHLLDERTLVHDRALRFWLAHHAATPSWLARVAYHALGTGERELATATALALAEGARGRGEHEEAQALTTRVRQLSEATLPAVVRAALAQLEARDDG